MNFRGGRAGQREVYVVNDEAAGQGGARENGGEPGRMVRGHFYRLVQLGRRHIARRLQLVVKFKTEILGKRDRGEPVERALPSTGDGAARDDKTQGRVQTDVDAAEDGVNRSSVREQMTHGDVDGIAGRAVDDPGFATEAAVGGGGVDGTIAGLCGAHPTLLRFRSDDKKFMAGIAEGVHELMQENAVDAIVVGDQETHALISMEGRLGCKLKVRREFENWRR